jgi:hypothetical protein
MRQREGKKGKKRRKRYRATTKYFEILTVGKSEGTTRINGLEKSSFLYNICDMSKHTEP